jgi:acid stress chaperone HdeB
VWPDLGDVTFDASIAMAHRTDVAGSCALSVVGAHQMLFKSLGLGLFAGLLSTTLSYGQVTVDMTTVTCEQFFYSTVSHPRTLSIWLSGYYHGKRDASVVNTQKVIENTDKVQRFCRQPANFKVPLMEAAERVLGNELK